MANVQLRNVRKAFGRTEVIKGIDLEIADGEFVVFVGPSGCGKSTLLRLIAGLEDVSDGEIWIGGREVTYIQPSERSVSMVFQSYALYPHMTAYKNIAFGLSLAGADRAAIDEKVRGVAAMLRIEELLDRKPRELSGGQRQRVAIARAIVRDPQAFLFDEPLSNLDAALRAQTRVEIAKMHQDLGATMIYVTHDQVEAMTLADRMVVLNNGCIEQVGRPADLYHRPATLFVAGFLGSPRMNLLPATVEGGHVRLEAGESLALDDGMAYAGEATLGIRPEDLELGESEGSVGLRGEVVLVEELGEARIVHVALPDGATLALRHRPEPPPRKGESVRVGFASDRCHVFDQTGRRIG